MGKKEKEEKPKDCTSCREGVGRLDDDFPCSRAQVVVDRGKPRANCKHWVAQAAIN